MPAELMVWCRCRSCVVRPSIVRPCRNYLGTHWTDSFQISVLGCPGSEPGWKWTALKKITFSDLLWIFQLSVKIRPYGNKNFKTLLLPQIALDLFLNFSEFSSQWSSKKKYCFGFLKFWVFDFSPFFSFSLTWDPMGGKTSRRYSSLKWLLNPFKLFSGFSSHWSSQKYCFWIFEVLSLWFSHFFSFFVTWDPIGAET